MSEGIPFDTFDELKKAYVVNSIKLKIQPSLAHQIASRFSKITLLLSSLYLLIGVIFIIIYSLIEMDYYPLISIPFLFIIAVLARHIRWLFFISLILIVCFLAFSVSFGIIIIPIAVAITFIFEYIWWSYVSYKAHEYIMRSELIFTDAWDNHLIALSDTQGKIYMAPINSENISPTSI